MNPIFVNAFNDELEKVAKQKRQKTAIEGYLDAGWSGGVKGIMPGAAAGRQSRPSRFLEISECADRRLDYGLSPALQTLQMAKRFYRVLWPEVPVPGP